MSHILLHALSVVRDDLVAGAVVAKRFAERNMYVQRERSARAVAGPSVLAVVVGCERFFKLESRRIRRIARPTAVIALDKLLIEADFLSVTWFHGADRRLRSGSAQSVLSTLIPRFDQRCLGSRRQAGLTPPNPVMLHSIPINSI